MRIIVLLLGVLAVLAVSSCQEEQEETWQPEGPLDLRASISSEKVELLGELQLGLDLYLSQELADKAGTEFRYKPELPLGFRGRLEGEWSWPVAEGTQYHYDLCLRPTKLGTLTIPAYKVEVCGETVTTPEYSIEVGSVLEDGHDAKKVEAPAPPFPPRVDLRPWLWGGALFLALVVVLVWWWRRPRNVFVPMQVSLPPHIKALRALEHLRHVERCSVEQIDAFYVAVSQILRVYLEERFGLRAPWLSTEEFLLEVEKGDVLSLLQGQSLRAFLEQCDLVKFARLWPEPTVHGQTFDTAEHFVQETRADQLLQSQQSQQSQEGAA